MIYRMPRIAWDPGFRMCPKGHIFYSMSRTKYGIEVYYYIKNEVCGANKLKWDTDLMGNRYTFKGRPLCQNWFCFPKQGSALNGKNLLPFFLFRLDPFSEGTW